MEEQQEQEVQEQEVQEQEQNIIEAPKIKRTYKKD